VYEPIGNARFWKNIVFNDRHSPCNRPRLDFRLFYLEKIALLNMPVTSRPSELTFRQIQRRDLEKLERLYTAASLEQVDLANQPWKWQRWQQWYGVLKGLSLFPNPLQHLLSTYVAEWGDRLYGVIQVSPFNHTRSTWRIDHILVNPVTAEENDIASHPGFSALEVGAQLLRYCFQTILEARTWLLEVNVNDKDTLALYRHSGFQPLARMTYWQVSPEQLQALSEREPDLPNLLPVSNADAYLLYQLDTVSMPPLVRQVYDRHILDFKTGLIKGTVAGIQQRLAHTDVSTAYVFEPQRKAAIGYYKLHLSRDGAHCHSAHLTVHPAYTWLYPELLAQMARVTATLPAQSLRLASSDYQPEREDHLEQIGAQRTEHTLMMSRSVWHKLRETKRVSLDGLQITDVLQGLQPARNPAPGRFSAVKSIFQRSVNLTSDLSRLNSEQNRVADYPSDASMPSNSDLTNDS